MRKLGLPSPDIGRAAAPAAKETSPSMSNTDSRPTCWRRSRPRRCCCPRPDMTTPNGSNCSTAGCSRPRLPGECVGFPACQLPTGSSLTRRANMMCVIHRFVGAHWRQL